MTTHTNDNPLTPDQRARVKWACRRGMKELDLALMPFFDYEYDDLSYDEQVDFIRLLEHPDPDLFNWLMNKGLPQDEALQATIELIQNKNKQRGAVPYA
ncbi:FAD assembly factor SdhE [Thorsellia anophelis]|uniref:FAD assembly factor SdhE n=1 Tax=Thorsellia anophelis DSM 18579 TaxID=1123402 RepID=A0A1I0B829_9GAMM|nr:FAD assembly factor SdhE [Thorsellia anophelis]SET02297.1 antitoxin CptB [Thorsellia anophelis DSM 18579]